MIIPLSIYLIPYLVRNQLVKLFDLQMRIFEFLLDTLLDLLFILQCLLKYLDFLLVGFGVGIFLGGFLGFEGGTRRI